MLSKIQIYLTKLGLTAAENQFNSIRGNAEGVRGQLIYDMQSLPAQRLSDYSLCALVLEVRLWGIPDAAVRVSSILFQKPARFINDDFGMQPQSRAVENDVLLNNVDKNGVNINDNGSVNLDRRLNLVGGSGASASALRLG